MLNAFWWLLTVEAMGLAAFPLTFRLLPRLRDRGYSVSKPLGILLIGYTSWILSQVRVLPSVRLSLIGLLFLLGGASALYAWRQRDQLKEFIVRERRAIVAVEAVFLVVFLGWAVFRAYDPAIDHTEQPMDLAFLNASIESSFGHPEDPWLKGEPVSYYYFGYWMMGAISQITGIASNVSYNLALALIPALGAAGIFGLVYNMVASEARRWRYALAGGLAAAVLLGVVANLEGVLELMRVNGIGSQGFWDWIRIDGLDGATAGTAESWRPDEFWWWFRATRVINTFDAGQGIDYTIQEFPFFSLLLGDLHPHVMSIPFATLFLAFCWNLFRSSPNDLPRLDLWSFAFVLAMGLALGGLAFTNMWDLPTFAALFLGLAALKVYQAWRGGYRAGALGQLLAVPAVIGLAVVLFLPYYLSFSSSLTGIEYVVTGTRPPHMLIIWALFLVAVTPLILLTFSQALEGDGRQGPAVSASSLPLSRSVVSLVQMGRLIYGWPAALALLVAFVPYLAWVFLYLEDVNTTEGLWGRFFHVLPLALLIGAAVYGAIWVVRHGESSGRAFALVLSALGLLLIMGPELLFVADAFGNRMNTVFKLYYQAWVLLAAASGFALYYWRSMRASVSGWRRSMTGLWAGVFVVLLAGSLYYPPAAAASKADLFDGDATLDGLAYVASTRQAEYDAIAFVRENVEPDSGIVEAVGEWFDAGLISRSTGVPTVFNWPGHEIQWRGSGDKLEGRQEDVARIYETLDVREARNLLARYDVEYVYVGPRERQQYGSEGLDKFSLPDFETVFSRDDVRIFRLAR